MSRRTDRVLVAFRIGDPDGRHPIYDGEGARLYPGRWNTGASPVIYASEHYSTAMLEKLVHANGMLPSNQHYIRITIPNGVSYEIFQTAIQDGTARTRESARRSAPAGTRSGGPRCFSCPPCRLVSNATS